MQPIRRRNARAVVVAIVAIAALIASLGCAGGRPTGPVFEPLAPPDATSTLIYVYRLDTLRGVNGGPLKLDDEKVATLRNGEYVAFVVDPGRHEFRAALLWLGFLARSWNSIAVEARPGETVFLKLFAATASIPGAPASAAVPGMSDQKADVGLFMSIVDRDTALLELRAMRRVKRD